MTNDKRKVHPIPPQGLGIRMQAVSNAHLSSAGWCYVPTGPGLPSAEEQMETLRHELNARGMHAESYAELQERIEPGAKDYLRPYATGIALYEVASCTSGRATTCTCSARPTGPCPRSSAGSYSDGRPAPASTSRSWPRASRS